MDCRLEAQCYVVLHHKNATSAGWPPEQERFPAAVAAFTGVSSASTRPHHSSMTRSERQSPIGPTSAAHRPVFVSGTRGPLSARADAVFVGYFWQKRRSAVTDID